MIMDTNGHELKMGQRHEDDQNPMPVVVGNDVFVGARVTILKGAVIGNGCVIAAGSVIYPHFVAPAHSTIGGNPAVILKHRAL